MDVLVKRIRMPGIEVGGEIDESLKAKLPKQVGFVNGERVGWVNSAPLGGFLLQCLHSSLISSPSLSLPRSTL